MVALENNSPSLLILDILMPEIDGIELIRNIRRTKPTLQIIAMSGGYCTENIDVLDVAKRLGATHTLKKPFEIRVLINMVQELLPRNPFKPPTPKHFFFRSKVQRRHLRISWALS